MQRSVKIIHGHDTTVNLLFLMQRPSKPTHSKSKSVFPDSFFGLKHPWLEEIQIVGHFIQIKVSISELGSISTSFQRIQGRHVTWLGTNDMSYMWFLNDP